MTSDEKEKFEHQDFLHLTPEDRKLVALSLARGLIKAGALEEEFKLEPIIIHRLQVGDYTITHQTHDGSFWIMNADGEGMQTTPEKLEKLIADFYYEEF